MPEKCMDVQTNLNDTLTNRRRRLQLQLAEVNAAIEALEQHPEVANVLNLVGKAIGRNF